MLNKSTWVHAHQIGRRTQGYVPGLVVAAQTRGLGQVPIAAQTAQHPPVDGPYYINGGFQWPGGYTPDLNAPNQSHTFGGIYG